jgi:protoporphyrinogen oxidase
MADIRALLGADLLDRPRHGRIRLRGRWIHFPLRPMDLFFQLDRGFALRVFRDVVAKPFRKPASEDSFSAVLTAQLGPAIAEDFYLPYARKIWGEAPERLSGIQARRRVSAGTVGKLVRKVLSQVPGFRTPGAGRFFYPRRGFGQIAEGYAAAAEKAGAEIRYRANVLGLRARPDGSGWEIDLDRGSGREIIAADYLWSTIPITSLANLIGGQPAAVAAAIGSIKYRAMTLAYLELPVEHFTEYDAHYFPEEAIRMTRLSEPKNYSAQANSSGRTVLCAELPCSVGDELWRATEEELGTLVTTDLARAGIPVPAAPRSVSVRRLPQAYPIYLAGYQDPLSAVERWIEAMPRVLSYGRQGLFAHDNTHHALAMAYAAVDCLRTDGFDRSAWEQHRKVFATHVVED